MTLKRKKNMHNNEYYFYIGRFSNKKNTNISVKNVLPTDALSKPLLYEF